jgi:hypothetical protein
MGYNQGRRTRHQKRWSKLGSQCQEKEEERGGRKVLVRAGEHVQASEVELLSADELKELLATCNILSNELEQVAHHGPSLWRSQRALTATPQRAHCTTEEEGTHKSSSRNKTTRKGK